jgi:hypothetical protein
MEQNLFELWEQTKMLYRDDILALKPKTWPRSDLDWIKNYYAAWEEAMMQMMGIAGMISVHQLFNQPKAHMQVLKLWAHISSTQEVCINTLSDMKLKGRDQIKSVIDADNPLYKKAQTNEEAAHEASFAAFCKKHNIDMSKRPTVFTADKDLKTPITALYWAKATLTVLNHYFHGFNVSIDTEDFTGWHENILVDIQRLKDCNLFTLFEERYQKLLDSVESENFTDCEVHANFLYVELDGFLESVLCDAIRVRDWDALQVYPGANADRSAVI